MSSHIPSSFASKDTSGYGAVPRGMLTAPPVSQRLAASEIGTLPDDDNHRTTITLNITDSPADLRTGPSILGDPHGSLLAGPRLSTAMTRTDYRTGEDDAYPITSCTQRRRVIQCNGVHDDLTRAMGSGQGHRSWTCTSLSHTRCWTDTNGGSRKQMVFRAPQQEWQRRIQIHAFPMMAGGHSKAPRMAKGGGHEHSASGTSLPHRSA
ncbi:hypothetical protein HBH69_229350 [Parastagonospora nodorum]|nr:hypothetical protein HBH69_229350 [Parastagonospora nodorum]KAH5207164.1 hypothetical protein HBI62_235270 [Parastagonospora nodorum]KAH5465673.1 hypothetical protein HBI28_224670 [Parastagonospora nodorum]KAH5618212.1 hypothetical protein HBI22_239490 [Parastagonospora nodorum]KAH5629739.1 hypothetical protein HBI23_224550 [Parastagonospora nodorum]